MAERYEIRGKLGKGGMSQVYRAYDSVMGREVALKRLLPLEETNLNEEAGEVLASEAAALAQFQHPNIVTVYAFEEDTDGPFVVMELIDGMDLHDVLRDGALSLDDFFDVAIQCLEPLVSAAEQNLQHRDIKPGNIMLTMTPSERFLVKILDFGLAKFSQQPSTQTLDQAGSFLGSIDFIAPEQLELQPLDPRTDLYSLGCVLYYALAQVSPFSGDSPATTSMNHLNHAVAPIQSVRPDVPDLLADWIMTMIARDREDRPSSALEALEQLRAIRKTTQPEEQDDGEVVVAIPVAEPVTTETRRQILTGAVKPNPTPSDGTGSVSRPILNTSPQVPRTGRTGLLPSLNEGSATDRGGVQWVKHPMFVMAAGAAFLGLLLFLLFREEEETGAPVASFEEPAARDAKKENEGPALESGLFVMPEPFELTGDPKQGPKLLGSPFALLRFRAEEGLLNPDLDPVTGDGEKVGIWVNLKSRTKWRSLYPLAGDKFAEYLPVRMVLPRQDVPALKKETVAVAFNNRDGLVTRTGALPLKSGFTIFFVGKLDPESGGQIFLEPNNGRGALASLRIGFNGNVIASTRMGSSLEESTLSVPWDEAGVGVIAYGCGPEEGAHRLLGFPASASKPEIAEGDLPLQPSPFRRLFLGKHDAKANPGGRKATWMLEVVLYDTLLTTEEMKTVSRNLSRFYFRSSNP